MFDRINASWRFCIRLTVCRTCPEIMVRSLADPEDYSYKTT